MDRDIAIKVKDALEGIETSFESIVTALNTIAENTTPADDTEPAANVNDSRGREELEEPAAESNVSNSRGQEELEEPEETKGGKK